MGEESLENGLLKHGVELEHWEGVQGHWSPTKNQFNSLEELRGPHCYHA